jgi:hypothetical protein
VWYLDATGSIIKPVNGQGAPYLFSIVAHDKKNNLLVPIAEFVTTDHTGTSISRYLLGIKPYIKVAPLTVTDQDFAEINALLFVFNNCDYKKYVEWTWSVLMDKEVIGSSFWVAIRFNFLLLL